MIELTAGEGELKAVIHVTRKETGKTETYDIVGKVSREQWEEFVHSLNENEPQKEVK